MPVEGGFVLSPLAAADIEAAYAYIRERNPPAASKFVTELRALASKLSVHPSMGRERPEIGRSIRSFPIGRYVVFYRTGQEVIEIARVLHGARDVDAAWEEQDY